MDDLEKVKRDILNVGGKIAGVVINKMPVSQKQYYATYYYGNSNMKLGSKKPTKADIEMQAEFRRKETKAKAKNVISQNNPKSEEKKIYNYEKEEKVPVKKTAQKEEIDAEVLLKQMNNYVNEEKNKLEKEDK